MMVMVNGCQSWRENKLIQENYRTVHRQVTRYVYFSVVGTTEYRERHLVVGGKDGIHFRVGLQQFLKSRLPLAEDQFPSAQ